MPERFRYSQEEIDVRSAKYAPNLRREFQLNLHFDRECAQTEEAL